MSVPCPFLATSIFLALSRNFALGLTVGRSRRGSGAVLEASNSSCEGLSGLAAEPWTRGVDSNFPGLPACSSFLLEQRERPARASKGHVLWLHLHNFGGTSICAEAALQGEAVGPENCNVPPDLCSVIPSERVSCGNRSAGGYSFTAIERTLLEEDFACSADMLYGVMLRDPLAGAASTYVANSFGLELKWDIFESFRTGVPPTGHGPHPCLPEWDTYQHMDNYATRTLSGNYFAPPGKLTRTDLEVAKQRLSRMDVVLILEELVDHAPQLQATLGWNVSSLQEQAPKKNSHPSALNTTFTGEEIEFLRRANSLDYELYEHGRNLARQLTLAAQFSLTPRPVPSVTW
mmetsp:Transcript_63389/g.138019  ORF Transcript_63389/g.138019 Transcript_63389/m.138019 type:complete len:347 (-) Transcript_63389:427-1467(-)|eukprot:CAMPEP_0170598432 /NCGR_PEP_ID=MMETSP0224-20130122/16247_1 /TAXON_ID=285029 /ORGANISM="Togula jolla, Strain CCCM 725" /LENGTH=346 /DNA_ID=CAMNT_0010922989 /DNA_START=70 /DNA_END=1110 /DNA_ORIENTATION=+